VVIVLNEGCGTHALMDECVCVSVCVCVAVSSRFCRWVIRARNSPFIVCVMDDAQHTGVIP